MITVAEEQGSRSSAIFGFVRLCLRSHLYLKSMDLFPTRLIVRCPRVELRPNRSGTSTFTAFVIEVERGEEKWEMEKRYSALFDFHKKASQSGAEKHGRQFPGKQLIGKDLSPDENSARLRALELYLQAVCDTTRDAGIVDDFFQTDPSKRTQTIVTNKTSPPVPEKSSGGAACESCASLRAAVRQRDEELSRLSLDSESAKLDLRRAQEAGSALRPKLVKAAWTSLARWLTQRESLQTYKAWRRWTELARDGGETSRPTEQQHMFLLKAEEELVGKVLRLEREAAGSAAELARVRKTAEEETKRLREDKASAEGEEVRKLERNLAEVTSDRDSVKADLEKSVARVEELEMTAKRSGVEEAATVEIEKLNAVIARQGEELSAAESELSSLRFELGKTRELNDTVTTLRLELESQRASSEKDARAAEAELEKTNALAANLRNQIATATEIATKRAVEESRKEKDDEIRIKLAATESALATARKELAAATLEKESFARVAAIEASALQLKPESNHDLVQQLQSARAETAALKAENAEVEVQHSMEKGELKARLAAAIEDRDAAVVRAARLESELKAREAATEAFEDVRETVIEGLRRDLSNAIETRERVERELVVLLTSERAANKADRASVKAEIAALRADLVQSRDKEANAAETHSTNLGFLRAPLQTPGNGAKVLTAAFSKAASPLSQLWNNHSAHVPPVDEVTSRFRDAAKVVMTNSNIGLAMTYLREDDDEDASPLDEKEADDSDEKLIPRLFLEPAPSPASTAEGVFRREGDPPPAVTGNVSPPATPATS